MNNKKTIKTMRRTKVGPSKFNGILSEEALSGRQAIGFCFELDSENCYFPVNSSLLELINDGWEMVLTKESQGKI